MAHYPPDIQRIMELYEQLPEIDQRAFTLLAEEALAAAEAGLEPPRGADLSRRLAEIRAKLQEE